MGFDVSDIIGDYEIDRLLGTIRFNNIKSDDIIGISYKIGKYILTSSDGESSNYEFVEFESENDPDIQEVVSYFNKMN